MQGIRSKHIISYLIIKFSKMKNSRESATDEAATASLTVSVNDYLFGASKHHINKKDLTCKQWVNFLRELINECKPYFGYFHGFNEISYLINRKWWERIEHTDQLPSHPKTEIVFSEGINEKTRIISITKCGVGLGGNREPKFEPYTIKGDIINPGYRYYVGEEICLTITGEVILISSVRDRCYSGEKYTKVSFEKMDNQTLESFIEKSFFRVTDTVECLQEAIAFGIERRKEQLEKMEEIGSTIKRMSYLLKKEKI